MRALPPIGLSGCSACLWVSHSHILQRGSGTGRFPDEVSRSEGTREIGRPSQPKKPAEQAGDGQARSRCELIDFPDSNPYPVIEVALPNRAAMPQTLCRKGDEKASDISLELSSIRLAHGIGGRRTLCFGDFVRDL